MTEDLVEFLRARLDEEERVAREAHLYSPSPWTAVDTAISGGMVCCDHDPMHSDPDEADTYVAGCEHRHDADFIAHWDPARVLAEVEANRRIVDWCAEVIGDRDLSDYGHFGALRDDHDALAVTLAVETLRLLVRPHANHPDYTPAWTPEDATEPSEGSDGDREAEAARPGYL